MTAQELTPRQRAAIAALLAAPSILAAAHNAGIGARTLYRWMEDPLFRKALQDAEGLAVDAASRRLLAGQSQALDTLGDLMQGATSEQVRRQAARDWLDMWLKVRELRDLENRITELEARLNVNQE